MAVTGFLTDSTLCIGCKACEVACKEWNDVPDDGFVWSGLSYDNTLALGHSTYRHVKFVEREPQAGCGGNCPGAHDVGVLVRRLQALRERRLPRGLSDRVDRPHRIRQRLRAARHLQRLRLLRRGLSVRRRRSPSGRRPRVQVHVLLRPPESGGGAGVRESVSDRIDPLRQARRPRARRRSPHRSAPFGRHDRCHDLESERDERRRDARVLHRARRPARVQPASPIPRCRRHCSSNHGARPRSRRGSDGCRGSLLAFLWAPRNAGACPERSRRVSPAGPAASRRRGAR